MDFSFDSLFAEKITNYTFPCFYEINNSEKPSGNPLQETCPVYQVALKGFYNKIEIEAMHETFKWAQDNL